MESKSLVESSQSTNNGSRSTSEVAFTVEAALEYWKTFDIENKKSQLEKTCTEMREMKTASIVGRKRLNEITKSFRAKSKDEQVIGVTELLKAYQEEIDQLSRRSKLTETAFFSLYKSIYEAPDPCQCIEELMQVVASGSTHQLEIERLKAELNQYEEEFQQLKNQDITIRRLEDQLQDFREQNEEKINEEVEKRTKEINIIAETKISEIKDEQRTLEKRLLAAIESMKQTQLSADRAQNQLFDVSSQAETRISALLSENSLLAEGTQRLVMKCNELENELSLLKSSNQSFLTKSSIIIGDNINHHHNNNYNNHKNSEEALGFVITDLQEEIRKKEDLFRLEKQKLESSIRDLSQQLTKERESLNRMNQELLDRPSKDEFLSLKRQYKMVQKIAFNVQDDEREDLNSTDPENTLVETGHLEALLSSRLKSLESELTEVRRNLLESKQQELAAKEVTASLKKSLDTSATLIARLEGDLEAQLNQKNNGGRLKQTSNNLSHIENGGSDQTSSELAVLLGVNNDSLLTKVDNNDTNNNNNQNLTNQMVSILQAQRDRYKERLTQVETSLVKLQQKFDMNENIKSQLEADNVALYSKIRFLQSFTKPDIIPHKMKRNNYGKGKGVHLFDDNNIEEGRFNDAEEEFEALDRRYADLYEQRMNPFVEFSQHERQRKIQELSVADRIVLNTTLAIVSNHLGR
eukprot:gene6821-9339_t